MPAAEIMPSRETVVATVPTREEILTEAVADGFIPLDCPAWCQGYGVPTHHLDDDDEQGRYAHWSDPHLRLDAEGADETVDVFTVQLEKDQTRGRMLIGLESSSPGGWVYLTPDKARVVAEALLKVAAAADNGQTAEVIR